MLRIWRNVLRDRRSRVGENGKGFQYDWQSVGAPEGEKEGWANVPPGTRTSLYANPEYAKVPFAKMTLDSINSADPTKPTVKPVPYVGVQFVAIPEFAGIATTVGQIFSAALAGEKSLDDALAEAQDVTTREMTKAGYIK